MPWSRLFARMPIRKKMLLVTMLATVLALMLASAVFLGYARYNARLGLVEDVSSLGYLLANRSTAALSFGDHQLAAENLAAVRSKRSVLMACILDKEMRVFASLDLSPGGKQSCLLEQQEARTWRFGGQYLDFFEPIVQQGERLGTVYLRASLEELESLWLKSLAVVVAIVLISGMLALLLSARLFAIVSQPLLSLTQTAQGIARKTLDQNIVQDAERVSKSSEDELGTLVDAFNNMLDQISERDRFLQEVNEHLEERVRQRTEELNRARELAEAANLAKSNFLARMSHELRTPLNAILGFSQLMVKDPATSAEHRQQLGIINRSGEHLLAMINDVLDLSKIEAGKMSVTLTVFEVRRLCQEVVDLMRFRAEEKELFLKLVIDDDVPQRICSDGLKLRQVILNLLGNAIKFTASGGVALLVSMPRPGILRVAVSDTGVGIDSAHQQAIFEPFVQAENLANAKGTGLGLAISRKICEMLNGRIGVESQPECGSCFWLEIPVEMATENMPVSTLVDTREVVGLMPGQPNWRILAAEDDESSQVLIRKLLEQIGMQVRIASNGEEAVHIFRQWQPDLVLMDIRMPVMDGLEATRIIRGLAEGATVPVLALTASALREEQPEILAAGCNDVLFKPINIQGLLTKIATLLPVQYRYEDETGMKTSGYTKRLERHFCQEEVRNLSQEVRSSLLDAARRLDAEALEGKLPEVEPLAPKVAQRIRELLQAYDFGQIVNIVESGTLDLLEGEQHG